MALYLVETRDNKKVQMCIGRKVQKDNSVDISSSAQLRAKIFQTTLSSEFPNFLKCMLPSHVTGGFWLSFPKKFCVSHLPKHDAHNEDPNEKMNMCEANENKYLEPPKES
ncbi:hypothetical protein H5410_010369 [Solanum commersonii]|uniref:Uncharacterized protein n=1 Tax=Solanum commersonii TaxID=4109 RepID=A0A9J6AM85_SOLCO|nr:hypothetical protein H5410_010369 [Solanum commersonii]